MYGLIGKFRCQSGQREALAAILTQGTVAMFETRPLGGIGLPAK